jgi:hypothetical protein
MGTVFLYILLDIDIKIYKLKLIPHDFCQGPAGKGARTRVGLNHQPFKTGLGLFVRAYEGRVQAEACGYH